MNNLNEAERNEQDLEMVINDYWLEMGQALVELENTKAYQTLFTKGYFTDFPLSLVRQLAQDGIVDDGLRPGKMEDLIGVSSLEDWLAVVRNRSYRPSEEAED